MNNWANLIASKTQSVVKSPSSLGELVLFLWFGLFFWLLLKRLD
jgi:hypothetical protein